jgi:mono/diheme cytochrome c family protein
MHRLNRAKLTRSAVMLAFAASPIIGCDDADQDERDTDEQHISPVEQVPTYEADVKSIVTSNCVSCHIADGIAPMPLDTYSDAKAWAPEIKRQVLARTMPPWSAGPDCNEYLGDRRLSDTQIETIAAWVDAGARRGKPGASKVKAKSAPQPLSASTEETVAFRPDVELSMPEVYSPKRTPDDYRCFVLPWTESMPTYITGVGMRPGNRQIVHHSVVSLVQPADVQVFMDRDNADPDPGYECFTTGVSGGQVVEGEATAGGANMRSALLGAFEKAELGSHFPYGTGVRVEPGSAIIIQQHYNTLPVTGPASDQSVLQFMVEAEVPNPAAASWLVNPQWMNPMARDSMLIAADDPDATVSVLAPARAVGRSDNFEIYWADLHMHTLGSRGELAVVREDGTRECLLRVDDWKFEWQETFFLKNPVTLGPGDSLYLECHWDNTADHQYIANGERLPVQDVWWGDGSRDEMCLGNFLVVQR